MLRCEHGRWKINLQLSSPQESSYEMFWKNERNRRKEACVFRSVRNA